MTTSNIKISTAEMNNINAVIPSPQFSRSNKKINAIDTNYLNNVERKKVVHISSQELTYDEVEVLNRGLWFTITPKRIPFESIICSVEDNI